MPQRPHEIDVSLTLPNNYGYPQRIAPRQRLKILESNVVAVSLYGAEMWRITRTYDNKLNVSQRTCRRRILKIHNSYARAIQPRLYITNFIRHLKSRISWKSTTDSSWDSKVLFTRAIFYRIGRPTRCHAVSVCMNGSGKHQARERDYQGQFVVKIESIKLELGAVLPTVGQHLVHLS